MQVSWSLKYTSVYTPSDQTYEQATLNQQRTPSQVNT
jgi:hypothetical protein